MDTASNGLMILSHPFWDNLAASLLHVCLMLSQREREREHYTFTHLAGKHKHGFEAFALANEHR